MDTSYSNWTIDDLLLEIGQRKLACPISEQSFPDPEDRKRRLVRVLEGDDELLRRHPEISKYQDFGYIDGSAL